MINFITNSFNKYSKRNYSVKNDLINGFEKKTKNNCKRTIIINDKKSIIKIEDFKNYIKQKLQQVTTMLPVNSGSIFYCSHRQNSF